MNEVLGVQKKYGPYERHSLAILLRNPFAIVEKDRKRERESVSILYFNLLMYVNFRIDR